MWPQCRLCAGWFCRPFVVREATWGSCCAAWLGVGSEWGSLVCGCFLALLLQPRLPGVGWAAHCACSFSCFNRLLPKPDLGGAALSSSIAVPHYLGLFSAGFPACMHCRSLLVVLPIQAEQPCMQAHVCAGAPNSLHNSSGVAALHAGITAFCWLCTLSGGKPWVHM